MKSHGLSVFNALATAALVVLLSSTPVFAQGPEGLASLLCIFGPMSLFCCPIFAAMLGFAAFMAYGARNWEIIRANMRHAQSVSIADLKPGQGMVRLHGVVSQVPTPLNPQGGAPLAILRLRMEMWDRTEGDWRVAADKIRATPFILKDDTGTVRVDPQNVMKHLLGGSGDIPDLKAFEGALPILMETLAIPSRKRVGTMRHHLWEIHEGQEVTIIGQVQQRDGQLEITKVGKGLAGLLVVSTVDPTHLDVQPQRQSAALQVLAIILGGIGLLGILGLCGYLVVGLIGFVIAVRTAP